MLIVFSIVKKNDMINIYIWQKIMIIQTEYLDPVTTGSPVNSAMQKVYENTNLDLTKKIMQSDLYQNQQ